MDKKSHYQVIILGSGAAGLTAAIYAARANLQPLVIEGSQPGGQLNLTTDVENFPGFPKGIMGPELMVNMRQQAERYGTRIVTKDIASIDLKQRPFVTTDNKGKTLEAHTVIIATGASANYLGLASEEKYKNMGVSACAVCDGALPRFRNQPLIVVGGGDSAAEEGHYLTKFASEIHLIHRRDAMTKASKIMAERLLSHTKVKPVWNSVVEEVIGDDDRGMTAARVKNLQTGQTTMIEAPGMFVAIGHTPNTQFLNGQVELDERGFIVLKNSPYTNTSVEGVFAAGDVADSIYKQ